jgi:hypothetical protein
MNDNYDDYYDFSDFDWEFYINKYKDLRLKNKSQAINHWQTIGMKAGLIANKNGCNFDWVFYTKYYQHIKNLNMEQAYNHYVSFSIIDNTNPGICCKVKLQYTIEKNMSIALKQCNDYIKKKETEEKLNILIRTSNRPDYFRQAINSILTQNYTNYKIYVSYDKIESVDYLKDYDIETIYMNIDSDKKYKFNLYNNYLMDKVTDGYILFLDDDDIYIHNNVFNIINDNLETTDDLLIWKFMRPDKLIVPINKHKIVLGTIDTTSFCFHSNYKLLERWGDKKSGDIIFLSSLLNKKKFNIKIIDYILTKTIFNDKIASFGN